MPPSDKKHGGRNKAYARTQTAAGTVSGLMKCDFVRESLQRSQNSGARGSRHCIGASEAASLPQMLLLPRKAGQSIACCRRRIRTGVITRRHAHGPGGETAAPMAGPSTDSQKRRSGTTDVDKGDGLLKPQRNARRRFSPAVKLNLSLPLSPAYVKPAARAIQLDAQRSLCPPSSECGRIYGRLVLLNGAFGGSLMLVCPSVTN